MGRSRRNAIVCVMGMSLAFLTFFVWNGDTNAADAALRNWALSFNNSTSVAVWENISLMGSVAVLSSLTIVSACIFAVRRNWQSAQRLVLAMLGAVALNTIIKQMVQRPRPDEVYAHTMPMSYSFPSGHALYSFTFYLTIAWIVDHQNSSNWTKYIRVVAIVLVALIGTSRIFLGVHYGSDILGSYLIATIWLMLLSTQAAVNEPQSTLRR